jgi:hypothetical protein
MPYSDVLRKDGLLYLAFYFPQYHMIPENTVISNGRRVPYTDWDAVRLGPRSLTPKVTYNPCEEETIASHDEYAYSNGVGGFIFYLYWLNNTLIMNMPIETFISKARKTKFLICFTNQSGLIGEQKYDAPCQLAYQILRYLKSPNYLTDAAGRKPLPVYGRAEHIPADFLNNMKAFLAANKVDVKLGFMHSWRYGLWENPSWSEFSYEFGPHMNKGSARELNYYSGSPDAMKGERLRELWQGLFTSWDSRPRIAFGRTDQKKCDLDKPNGHVSPDEFGLQVADLKNNISSLNHDRIVTIFAWNEWAEGATLEESEEFDDQFIRKL